MEHTRRILNYSAKIIDYPILKRNIFFLFSVYSLVTKKRTWSFFFHDAHKERDEKEKRNDKKNIKYKDTKRFVFLLAIYFRYYFVFNQTF